MHSRKTPNMNYNTFSQRVYSRIGQRKNSQLINEKWPPNPLVFNLAGNVIERTGAPFVATRIVNWNLTVVTLCFWERHLRQLPCRLMVYMHCAPVPVAPKRV